MGSCASCLRLLLNESDVKIHVIEPTSVVGGEHSEVVPQQNTGPTLQVPSPHRPRTPEGAKMVSSLMVSPSVNTSTLAVPTVDAKENDKTDDNKNVEEEEKDSEEENEEKEEKEDSDNVRNNAPPTMIEIPPTPTKQQLIEEP